MGHEKLYIFSLLMIIGIYILNLQYYLPINARILNIITVVGFANSSISERLFNNAR